MMKKVLFGLSAILALFATSCQNELDQNVATGDTSTVTFEVAIPELATRAYSDGHTAKVLHYAVYDAKQKEGSEIVRYLEGLVPAQWPKFGEDQLTTTIQLELVTGNTYKIAFWAAADGAPYVFDLASATVKVKYDGAVSNDEKRDAFFGSTGFTVEGKSSIDVKLRRPFAQLNIGTSDYAAAEAANFIPEKSKVVVRNVYGAFNLLSGEVDETTEAEVTFDYGTINKEESFPVEGYKYIAMNYLLVDTEKSVVDVEFSYWDKDYDAKTRSVGSVPVQRNYRTNVYGKIFTSTTDLNVEIVPEYYKPDVVVNPVVVDAAGLQAALDAAPSGVTTVISLIKDIEGDVIDFQRADRHIIIEGGNNKYNGTIKIHNGSNVNNGSITIKNVNFETETAGLNFIMPNEFGVENGVTRRYSNNVSVENCTFTATGAAENTAVGVQAKSTFGYLKVINCTATGMHSLIQAQSCGADVTVEGATIDGKNGVAFKQVKKAIVKGSTINAAEYGIRFDGNIDNYGIEMEGNNITAKQPIIVRKMTGKDNFIALSGENTLTTNEDYQIVITDGSDDAEYVYPTGTYTLTGNINGYSIYPINTTGYAFQSAIEKNTTGEITLPGNLTSIGKGFEVKKDMIFNFDNKVLNAGSDANSYWYAIEATGDYDVVINDANFTRAGVFASEGANVVFNSGVINHNPQRTSRYIFCARSGSTITVKDGTFKNDRARNSYFWADAATIIVEGGDFGGVASNNKVVTSDGGQVIIKGGTFNFDPEAWVADGYRAIKVGNKWYVVLDSVDAIVTTPAQLEAAFAADDVTNIYLAGGDYGTIVAKSNKTIIGSDNATVAAVNLNGTDNFTVKNITFDAADAVMGYDGSGNAKQYANIISGDNTNKPTRGASNVVIDGCTFTGTFANGGASIAFTDQKRTSGFSGNVTIKNCTFETKNAYYNIYGHYTGNKNNFVIENNIFKSEFKAGGPIYLGRYASSVPVVVKGNTFVGATQLDDVVGIQDHSNYGVSIDATNNTFAE